jgi:hypothetical protein
MSLCISQSLPARVLIVEVLVPLAGLVHDASSDMADLVPSFSWSIHVEMLKDTQFSYCLEIVALLVCC